MVSMRAWCSWMFVGGIVGLEVMAVPLIPRRTPSRPSDSRDDKDPFNPTLLPGVASVTQSSRCNIHGTPTSLLADRRFNSDLPPVKDVVQCQAACRAVSQCQSYAFTLGEARQNCVFYMAQAEGNVVPFPADMDYDERAGWWFSDKYPSEKVDYCYRRANGSVGKRE
ncbi:hypothetical protein P152DRAFT_110733 [Eremomyces bilateralis CBS 781.70]|uniref:Apple domain-containing protein n=1 Tax=Eremomyces bilateralis CBS 781.70 TaxID=1392243 RepID=A0A6G1GDC5_9PEZI|nr:uncharacterized protein P152DRAFT_110733 [Eremomyces bilateralis CBS 781.70]KAF1816105.1 hypothetical protein P152DRAFT_110733 [Eremomyces bilateralis CBS 781.70]